MGQQPLLALLGWLGRLLEQLLSVLGQLLERLLSVLGQLLEWLPGQLSDCLHAEFRRHWLGWLPHLVHVERFRWR